MKNRSEKVVLPVDNSKTESNLNELKCRAQTLRQCKSLNYQAFPTAKQESRTKSVLHVTLTGSVIGMEGDSSQPYDNDSDNAAKCNWDGRRLFPTQCNGTTDYLEV